MREYKCIILIIDHTNTLDNNKEEDKCLFEFRNVWKKYMNIYDDILSLFVRIDETLTNGEYRLELEDNTIYVHGKESLQLGILEKTVYSIKYLSSIYKFDFMMRTNLSCFFDFHKLRSTILSLQLNDTFAGRVVCNSFINGGFQIISSNLILNIVQNIDNIINSYNGSEDVTISNFIKNYVPVINITNMFNFTYNEDPPGYCEFKTIDELDKIIERSDKEGYYFYRVKFTNNSEYYKGNTRDKSRNDDIIVHNRLYNYYYSR
jgi:hypothetical protein